MINQSHIIYNHTSNEQQVMGCSQSKNTKRGYFECEPMRALECGALYHKNVRIIPGIGHITANLINKVNGDRAAESICYAHILWAILIWFGPVYFRDFLNTKNPKMGKWRITRCIESLYGWTLNHLFYPEHLVQKCHLNQDQINFIHTYMATIPNYIVRFVNYDNGIDNFDALIDYKERKDHHRKFTYAGDNNLLQTMTVLRLHMAGHILGEVGTIHYMHDHIYDLVHRSDYCVNILRQIMGEIF